MTPSYASPLAMQAFLRTKNPLFPFIAQAYFDACEAASLNALKVFCHAITCSDYFRDARASKNDFFNSGLNMQTVFDGVASHVEHILQIGGINGLPANELQAMSLTENKFEVFANVNHAPAKSAEPLPIPEPNLRPAWKVKLAGALGALGALAGIAGWFLPGPIRELIKLVIAALKAVVQ